MDNFVVIGGGPTGSTIAAFLAKAGKKVLVFDTQINRDLYVGESLIPALIPILQKLEIEEKVKSFSVYKPGASVWLTKEECAESSFGNGKNTLPPYAYNTDRIQFDKTIKERAIKLGAQFETERIDVSFNGDICVLPQNVIEKYPHFFNGHQPYFIIDATGRKRLLANKAKLESLRGQRHDIALFAHVEGNQFDRNEGDIHMHRAATGWCWRIPLREKTSVGIVMDKEHWQMFGQTKEERFDNFLKKDEELKGFLSDTTRLTEVQQYSNYQLEATRFYGKNWVLIGDAAGFLDPIFSSGLYLGMQYAEVVAEILINNGNLSQYQSQWKKEVKSWKKMVDIWYNGRLFTTFRVGEEQIKTPIGKAVEGHIVKHFTSIFTGEAVKSPYSMWLLSFMTGYLIDVMRIIGMHKHKRKMLAIR